jgi:hypothetical protein
MPLLHDDKLGDGHLFEAIYRYMLLIQITVGVTHKGLKPANHSLNVT